VVIRYEMVHEARVIPLDGRPHVSSVIQSYMGDSRGRYVLYEYACHEGNYALRNILSAARAAER
jgi:hypothetical protein